MFEWVANFFFFFGTSTYVQFVRSCCKQKGKVNLLKFSYLALKGFNVSPLFFFFCGVFFKYAAFHLHQFGITESCVCVHDSNIDSSFCKQHKNLSKDLIQYCSHNTQSKTTTSCCCKIEFHVFSFFHSFHYAP